MNVTKDTDWTYWLPVAKVLGITSFYAVYRIVLDRVFHSVGGQAKSRHLSF